MERRMTQSSNGKKKETIVITQIILFVDSGIEILNS